MKKISIIIPAYNVQNYITESVQAACDTADEFTEIIIVNDGSTDKTAECIEKVVSQNRDKNIRVYEQTNQGVSAARNKGIAEATGEYIVFCDGDDRCKTELISELRRITDTSQLYDMILWGFDAYRTDSDKYEIIQEGIMDLGEREEVFKRVLWGEIRVRLGSFAVSSEFIGMNNIEYTVGCPLSQDMEFIYKCLAMAQKITAIDKVMFTYVKRAGSVMFRYNLNRFEAPRTMKRVYEYIKSHTDMCNDSEIDDFLHNGLFLQHLIYAFDACIPYLSDKDNKNRFWSDYYSLYPDIEDEVSRIKDDIIIYPANYNLHRSKLLLLSRKAYVKIMYIKGKMNENC